MSEIRKRKRKDDESGEKSTKKEKRRTKENDKAIEGEQWKVEERKK